MNPVYQDQSPGRAASSLANPQPGAAGVSPPASDPSPEFGLGALAVAIDQAGFIVAAEPIVTPLFQWQPAELIGQSLEVLLWSGADKIRQQLVPDPGTPDFDSMAPPRLFALARRKDDTSFAVAVTLKRQAGFWWEVTFHSVDPPPSAHAGIRAVGLPQPTASVRRRRARVTDDLAMEGIPDVFQRTPAEPAPEPELPASAPAVASEPPALAAQTPLSQDQLAPAAPPAQAAPAKPDTRLQEMRQRLDESTAELLVAQAHLRKQEEQLDTANTAAQQATAAMEAEMARRIELEAQLAQAQSQPPPAPAPDPSAEEPALQDQILELESRLRTAVSSLARTAAELEAERGERGRSEQRAAGLAARMQQLHEELRTHLASEQTDHERLAALEQQLREQGQLNDLAVARLQSALQSEECERKRLETELLCARAQSTDSARAGRALVNRLRRQLQPPVDSLHQDVCRLLQLQLADDQKQLLQATLENILLVQNSLRESSAS